jgi:hypothetical protein
MIAPFLAHGALSEAMRSFFASPTELVFLAKRRRRQPYRGFQRLLTTFLESMRTAIFWW